MKTNSVSTQGGFLIPPLVARSFINSFNKYSWRTYYVPGTRQGIDPVCSLHIRYHFGQHKGFCSELSVLLASCSKVMSFLFHIFLCPEHLLCPVANWSLLQHPDLLCSRRYKAQAGKPRAAAQTMCAVLTLPCLPQTTLYGVPLGYPKGPFLSQLTFPPSGGFSECGDLLLPSALLCSLFSDSSFLFFFLSLHPVSRAFFLFF